MFSSSITLALEMVGISGDFVKIGREKGTTLYLSTETMLIVNDSCLDLKSGRCYVEKGGGRGGNKRFGLIL